MMEYTKWSVRNNINMLAKKTKEVLQKITDEINKEYGFENNIPRINYGPCGVFAQFFFKKWNELFKKKVHICFILTKSKDECDHVLIKLPSGELYDGGIGIHTEDQYLSNFFIEEMIEYNAALLEKWSYGLERTYPRFCPHFDRKFVERVVNDNLNNLVKIQKL